MTKTMIGDDVVLGDDVVIGEGVMIHGNVVIGNNVRIHPYVIIGDDPEHLKKSRNMDKTIYIGDDTVIRSFVTIDAPTEDDMYIGSHCYLMSKSHVGHDAKLGNFVTLSTGSMIGGHADLHQGVNVGLNASVHQHVVVGAMSIIGMNTPVTKHVLPFVVVKGNPPRWNSINKIGIERYQTDDRVMRHIPVPSWEEIYNIYTTSFSKFGDNDPVPLLRFIDNKFMEMFVSDIIESPLRKGVVKYD